MNKINKYIDFLLIDAIEDSNNMMDLYYLELKYYKNILKKLENNKPIFLFKNKIKKYEIEKKEIIDKIQKCESKIKKEYDLINNLIIEKNSN